MDHQGQLGLLAHEAYEDVGCISEALARYADLIWAGIEIRRPGGAERVIIQLMRPLPDGDRAARRTVLCDECDENQRTVGQRLPTSQLLVMHRIGGDPNGVAAGLELAHDSLLPHWGHLYELCDEHRAYRLWVGHPRQRMATVPAV